MVGSVHFQSSVEHAYSIQLFLQIHDCALITRDRGAAGAVDASQ